MSSGTIKELKQEVLPGHINNTTLILNPNDALSVDLKLFEYTIALYEEYDDFTRGNGNSEEISLQILNDCPTGTIKMSLRRWKKLNKPDHITLIRDGNKYFIKI